MKRTLTLAAALTLGAAALAPLTAIAQSSVFVTTAPPAMRTESVPGPRDGYVWVPGYWNWENNRHVWIQGQWEPVRRGYQYQRPEWQRADNGWRLNPGGWQPVSDSRMNELVRIAPPAPRYESVPGARDGYVWVPGYWNWENNRHEWVAGRWEEARRGAQYQRAEWVRDGDGWRLSRGGWQDAADRRNDRMISVAPPPPRYERIPRARPGYVWVTGHWAWRGNRHQWVAGSWVRDRPGFRYRGAEWVLRDGQWNLEEARWERIGRDRNNNGIRDRDERRDQDRDGVADAYDRDRDNDGVRNRNDADRDGDGVRNDQDRYPDDVRRY